MKNPPETTLSAELTSDIIMWIKHKIETTTKDFFFFKSGTQFSKQRCYAPLMKKWNQRECTQADHLSKKKKKKSSSDPSTDRRHCKQSRLVRAREIRAALEISIASSTRREERDTVLIMDSMDSMFRAVMCKWCMDSDGRFINCQEKNKKIAARDRKCAIKRRIT